MSHENKIKSFKKDTNKHSKKNEELSKKKKKHQDSDDDNGNDSDFISDDDEEFDVHEYRKLLKTMFPSKYLDKKIKSGEKLKTMAKEFEE